MGKRPLNIPEVRDKMVQAVLMGANKKTAASFADISESTYYYFINLAERAQSKKRKNKRDLELLELLESVERAREEFKMHNLTIIQLSAQGQIVKVEEITRQIQDPETGELREVTEVVTRYDPPKSEDAKWLLERIFPEEFGRRQTHEISAKGAIDRNGYGNTNGAVLTYEEYKEILLWIREIKLELAQRDPREV